MFMLNKRRNAPVYIAKLLQSSPMMPSNLYTRQAYMQINVPCETEATLVFAPAVSALLWGYGMYGEALSKLSLTRSLSHVHMECLGESGRSIPGVRSAVLLLRGILQRDQGPPQLLSASASSPFASQPSYSSILAPALSDDRWHALCSRATNFAHGYRRPRS